MIINELWEYANICAIAFRIKKTVHYHISGQELSLTQCLYTILYCTLKLGAGGQRFSEENCFNLPFHPFFFNNFHYMFTI